MHSLMPLWYQACNAGSTNACENLVLTGVFLCCLTTRSITAIVSKGTYSVVLPRRLLFIFGSYLHVGPSRKQETCTDAQHAAMTNFHGTSRCCYARVLVFPAALAAFLRREVQIHLYVRDFSAR